jgi:hypothetical protein
MAEVESKNSPEVVKKFTDMVTTYKIGGVGKKRTRSGTIPTQK